jgi:SAM-dependent methyltransferase
VSSSTLWHPVTYRENARFVSDLGAPVIELLNPNPGEIILDLGCGDGALTEKIAAAGAKVYGADTSLTQLRACKMRPIPVVAMDGQRLSFRRSFDAVFTNAALHWMKQAENVLSGVANCLKPGGRFVGEFGGKGNVENIRAALHDGCRRRGIDPWMVDPWYYPAPEDYSKLLSTFGLQVEYIDLIPRPTQLPGDILDWLAIFAQPFTTVIAPPNRQEFLNEVRNILEPSLRDAGGTWTADYVRLRFKSRFNYSDA